MKKKKKSKKAAFDLEAFETELEDASKPAAADGDEDDGGDGPAPAIDYDEEGLGENVFAAPSAGAGGDSSVAGDAVETWHSTDRDYTYAKVHALLGLLLLLEIREVVCQSICGCGLPCRWW